ncbi:MAG: hypothetical protein IJD58_12560 [Lachnospiraceae bacterium]|nr:hypothetical protein [Lachnospiraceae bacterium]
MNYALKVDGNELTGTSVTSVELVTELAADDEGYTQVYHVGLKIRGNIVSEGSLSGNLFAWSLVKSDDPQAYKPVEVACMHHGKSYRNYKLPKAFVVDYAEEHDESGEPTYYLYVKQKRSNAETASVWK